MIRRTRLMIAGVLALVLLPIVLWFWVPYVPYRLYMRWLASGVIGGYGQLPAPLVASLAPHYADDLSQTSYAFTKRLPPGLGIADCTTIYFGDSGIVEDLKQGRTLSKNELWWLAHELTHGEQCQRWGGRKRFAETWFSQADTQAWKVMWSGGTFSALRAWLGTRNIPIVHDAMPMELEADERAGSVVDASR